MAIKTYYLLKRFIDTSEKNLPFYVENLGTAGNISLNSSYSDATNVEYSTDNETWTTAGMNNNNVYTIPVAAVGKVYIRANATYWGLSAGNYTLDFARDYKVGGNMMSLLYGSTFTGTETSFPDATKSMIFYKFFSSQSHLKSVEKLALPATTLAKQCYQNMFESCSSITSAPILPATTLAQECYEYMFSRCTSLTAAPALPATTLASYCYQNMFFGCTALTTAPALPATTLAFHCYEYMFNYCTALTDAPALPATTLAEYCYTNMFRDCASLTVAPELPATTLVNACYSNMFFRDTNLSSITVGATSWNTSYANQWLFGVSATGTFTKPTNTTIPTGTDGIPSGWTVVNV